MWRFVIIHTFLPLAQIYDRDGLTLGEFVKGDMYIRDLKNTKGHISGLTCGEWHPKTKETILTSSEDGSLRIWDVNDFKSQKQVSLIFCVLLFFCCNAICSPSSSSMHVNICMGMNLPFIILIWESRTFEL